MTPTQARVMPMNYREEIKFLERELGQQTRLTNLWIGASGAMFVFGLVIGYFV